jgi:formylglycine-generating enzyme required for sulfatase activity
VAHHLRILCLWLLTIAVFTCVDPLSTSRNRAWASEPAATAPKGKKFALLVGVREYDSKSLTTLSFTERDVVEMGKVLREQVGFHNVRVLSNSAEAAANKPTAKNVRDALAEMTKGKTKHDTVLLMLCGHGVQIAVPDPTGEGPSRTYTYFCPKDADLNDVRYQDGRSNTMILMEDVLERFDKSNAGANLLFVDACRNEISAKRGLASDSLKLGRNTLALLSCGRGQFSFEPAELKHGLFTYFLLKGLKGEAVDRRGDITWASLVSYAQQEVADYATNKIGEGAKQTPTVLSNFEGNVTLVAASRDVVKNPPSKESVEKSTAKEDVKKMPAKPVGKSMLALVSIEGGTFEMGSPSAERGRSMRGEDQRKVKVGPFEIGMYEVTRGEYKAIMESDPSLTPKETDRQPVENVSYEDAVAFCKALSTKEGRKYRLPTEAEWEYACRANAKTYQVFHFGDSLDADQANIAGDAPYGGGREKAAWPHAPVKVDSYKANSFGLYNMHGNVAEWCTTEDGDSVLRGGQFDKGGASARSAARLERSKDSKSQGWGFRVVREVE